MAASASGGFPRGALLGAGALIAFAITAAALTQRFPPAAEPAPPLAQSRDLRFEDRADGSVAVRDADGELVTSLAPGTNGFARALLRGLASDRRREGFDAEPPFRLAVRTDGALILEDTATGRVVALEAFGATNAGVFAALLTAGRAE